MTLSENEINLKEATNNKGQYLAAVSIKTDGFSLVSSSLFLTEVNNCGTDTVPIKSNGNKSNSM